MSNIKYKQLLKKATRDYFNEKPPDIIEENDLWRIKQNLRDTPYREALNLKTLPKFPEQIKHNPRKLTYTTNEKQ